MKLAILTCSEMPNMLPYDKEVISMLQKRGVNITVFIWDELLSKKIDFLLEFDAVLLRTIWDYFEKIDDFLILLDSLEALNVPVFNPIDVVRWNMDKKYLAELQDEGFDIIPTIFNFNGEDNSFAKAVSNGWEKMILKPMISGGSYHTFVINSNEESKFNKFITEYYINRPFILQEFIPEISEGEISTLTLSDFSQLNKEYSYSVIKVPKKGDYRVQFNFGGVYSISEVDPVIKSISSQITKRFGNRLLYQRLDGLWRNGKFLIMEIELIEPDLYLNFSKEALNYWVDSLVNIIKMN